MHVVDVDAARDRARELSGLNAFIALSEESGSGPVVAVKDLVDVAGMVTTGGGRILPSVPAEFDAPVIETMRRNQGVVVVGKANLHEWAYGATSENPHYGAVGNPVDPSRIAGGSSGGSAVAVATGMCDWALGSDTAGSIRIPASFCGVVGIRPTIGTVDTETVIPLSRSLDTLGPLAPDVATAARALEAMSQLTNLLPAELAGTPRLGVPRGWVAAVPLDEATSRAWTRLSTGLPEIDFLDRAWLDHIALAVQRCEAYAYHRRWFESDPERYGSDVAERLREAAGLTRDRYVDALLELARARAQADAVMVAAGVDALLLPAVPFVAPKIGAGPDRRLLLGYTRPISTTGQPVVTLPVPSDGLPVGMQVIGRHGREADLIAAALDLEQTWRRLPG